MRETLAPAGNQPSGYDDVRLAPFIALFYLNVHRPYGNSTCTETMEYQRHTFFIEEYDPVEGWLEVHSTPNDCYNCRTLRSPETAFYVFEAAAGTQVRVQAYYYASGYTGGCDGEWEFFGPWIF